MTNDSPEAAATPPTGASSNSAAAGTLSLRRLNLMRLGYALMGVGLAVTKWPLLVNRDAPWPLFEGVATYMLVAMGLLAFLGLRYPARMLPILLFESAWKVIWLAAVAWPLSSAGQTDPATSEVARECLWVVIVLVVIPWRHVVAQYLSARGDPWRAVRRV